MQTSPTQRSRAVRVGLWAALPVAACTVGLAAIAVADPPPPGNLVFNPSFESGTAPATPTGWQGYEGTVSKVDAAPGDAVDGTAFANVFAHPGVDNLSKGFAIDDKKDAVQSAVAGTQFTATAWMRAAVPQSLGKIGKLWIRERDAGSTSQTGLGMVMSGHPLTGVWQQYTVSYVAQQNGTHIDAYVAQSPAAVGDAFSADLITLTANLPPAVTITTSPAKPMLGDPITFTANATDPEGGPIAAEAWDVDGDGQFNDGATNQVSHTFTAPGAYTVSFRAADAAGATSITQVKVQFDASGVGTVTGGQSGAQAGTGTGTGTGAGAGGGATTGNGGPAAGAKPRITKFKLLSRHGKKAVSFRLSEPASAKLALSKANAKARTKAARARFHAVRSLKAQPLGGLTHTVSLGKLAAARYRITFTLRDAGGSSAVVVRGFRIR